MKSTILSKIAVLLGGRSAEKIIYDDVSTGAADDIEKASSLIYQYSCIWGMNEKVGILNPKMMDEIGSNLNSNIFDECKIIMGNLEKFVITILKENDSYFKIIAETLLEFETINYEKIKMIVPNELEDSIDIKNYLNILKKINNNNIN